MNLVALASLCFNLSFQWFSWCSHYWTAPLWAYFDHCTRLFAPFSRCGLPPCGCSRPPCHMCEAPEVAPKLSKATDECQPADGARVQCGICTIRNRIVSSLVGISFPPYMFHASARDRWQCFVFPWWTGWYLMISIFHVGDSIGFASWVCPSPSLDMFHLVFHMYTEL